MAVRISNGPILRFGMFHIYLSAIFLPAIIYFLNAGYFVLLTAIAVILHELGHYISLCLCGGEIKRLKLWIGGISMVYGGLGYTGDALTALMGPAASLLLAVASSLFGRVFSCTAAYHLAGLSLLITLFNLLPVYPLDGGRALFSLMAKLFGLPVADLVRKICNVMLTAALGLIGSAMLYFAGNPTLLISSVFLAFCAGRSEDYCFN